MATARFTTRQGTADDAAACERLLRRALGEPPASAAEISVSLQTGRSLWLAMEDGEPAAMARQWSDEGIDWFDLFCSCRPWAGVTMLRRLGTNAQDRGIRLLRTRGPDDPRCEDYLGRSGFRPVARDRGPGGKGLLVFERRLPLLTVRELRRSDADEVAAHTGGEAWDFQYAVRPGWFVLADGDRFAGYVRIREADRGTGRIEVPFVLPGYEGRGLELWMVERCVYYAETHGFRVVDLVADPALEALGRGLEGAGWVRSGAGWRRSLADAPSYRSGERETGQRED